MIAIDAFSFTYPGVDAPALQDISLRISPGKAVLIRGASGSGKSTLAFDTIFAEGQRRYLESLSSYARQFLGQMEKPDVDYIEGLSPAISIDQKATSRNPRSTVGTVTEIHDYLRLLYAKIGRSHCPVCGQEISGLDSKFEFVYQEGTYHFCSKECMEAFKLNPDRFKELRNVLNDTCGMGPRF